MDPSELVYILVQPSQLKIILNERRLFLNLNLKFEFKSIYLNLMQFLTK